MKFKSQPYKSMLCGQACLSMITEKTIEEICLDIGKDYLTSIQGDLQPFLNRNKFKTRLISGQNITFNEVPNNSVIRVSYPSSNAHFVVKTKNQNIRSVSRYH